MDRAFRSRSVSAALSIAVVAIAVVAIAGAASAKGKKPPPPPPLEGATIDYAWDGKDIGHPERAWLGRAFVHDKAKADASTPRPLLVFVHGLNTERIKYRWMGGGNEGDVRRIVSGLIASGKVPPMIVAAPSSIVPEAVTNAVTSWPAFDLDRFLEQTRSALAGTATIDPSRVIVAAHSGGGCNAKGGIASAIRAQHPIRAALVIDTCMLPEIAKGLASARADMHVVVSWQTLSWSKRPIDAFRTAFLAGVQQSPPAPGILRELEHVRPKEPMPHDAMVGITLGHWLPELLAKPAVP
jgi:hypothetical protein